MRILCVQLPNQDPSNDGARYNVPFAAAKLMAYAESRGAVTRDEWSLLDQDCADYGGDAAIASAVARVSPDLMVFRLFDWNLERSLWLVKRLRAVMPATHFVAGGPEVVQGMPVFRAHAFDALIEGEWEEPFLDVLADLSARALKPRYAASQSLDLEKVPDPYLAGVLPVNPGKPVIIESARGVSTMVAFRAYGETGVRFLPRDTAPKVLRLASDGGVEEAQFIDPRLDDRPDFKGFVKALAAANEAGVSLSGKLDPAGVDDELARLLADAAFMELAADLGSVNSKALHAVGLDVNRDGLERGSRLLWSQGMVVKPDVYLGLPYDSYETTIETFDYLGMAGMGQDAALHPMPITPGSAIRADTAAFGVKEFLERPPYWVIETEWMDEDALLDAVADFEESFDVAWSSPVPPNFTAERAGFSAFCDLRQGSGLDAMLVAPERLASSVTLLLDADDLERASRVARAARDIRKHNPYTLWQIVLFSDTTIPSLSLARKLVDAFAMPEHYFELARMYTLDPQPEFQVRCFFATSSEAMALVALRDRQDLETVFVLGDAMPGPRLLEAIPFLAFDRESASFELLYDVMSAYRAYPELLVEAPRVLFSTTP
ncbi:MAG: hypothetical protein JXM71_02990 [Spirochaetales bacterium]|nr:hypothetical protein [Spirochaetales bacterium]